MYNIQYNNNSRNNNIIIIKSDNIAAKGSSSSWRCRCRCRCRVVAAAVAVSFFTAPKQYGDFVARVAMAGPGVGNPPSPVLCLSVVLSCVPSLVLQPNLWVVAFVKLFHICLSHRGCFALH